MHCCEQWTGENEYMLTRKWAFLAGRIYATVHFKEVRRFLFIHSKGTPLFPVSWANSGGSAKNCGRLGQGMLRALSQRTECRVVQRSIKLTQDWQEL